MEKKLFITGISGCVGQYLFDALADNPDYQLYLLVRNPQKLKFDYEARSNVTVIQDSLENIERHTEMVKQMDCVIHLAAAWGSMELNYNESLAFFKLLEPDQCKKVIYFSTASILDSDNQPIEEAEKLGTPYIRSKYNFYKKLPELKIFPNVITLFPTWVLGGDNHHPYSHASAGLVEIQKWLWLIRFFTVDASFHFIHARDIANIVKHLLRNDVKEKNIVLGNPLITANQFIKEVCRFYKKQVYFQIPISLSLVKTLAFLTGRKLQRWDLFCFEKRYFEHQVKNAESFGIKSDLQTVEQILKDLLPAKPV